ncbi:peptidase U32 family protein [uncultured Campylobacter sp.]|uniref:peptidase U32 family protein n=1 Tax=uncultured Campylobacter sp. TaxID=218934 RepID=UPI002621C9DE|nr:peptidase U32 family protein [uncultured Campylobacter sp.]
MKKIELLSPAGNLTKLQIAINYGADAIYASVGNFSLRQRSAKDFTKESFAKGVEIAKEHGKKFYAAVNSFAFNSQLEKIKEHMNFLNELKVDGVIVSTPATIALAKELLPHSQIHLSTQANVMNYLDAKFYYELGVSRIVAAREMSLKDAIFIKEMLPNLELEMFCHGSMCFAYSGRCLISAVQSGRFSNRGSCANDCRFNYELYAKDPENGALFRLEENSGDGTMIMNSKDLNLINHIEKLISSNAIDSLKIEGRTKSEYYVACSTNAYRMAMDEYNTPKFDLSKYNYELNSLSNRGFMDGYVVKRPYERLDSQNLDSSQEDGTHQVVAMSDEEGYISVKSKIILQKPYEILSANKQLECCDNDIGRIYQENGRYMLIFKRLITKNQKELSEVHSGNLNPIKLPIKLAKFSFLREKIKENL